MITPTQSPLPDTTQQSQERVFHASAGFEPASPESERPQTHTLDGAATGIDCRANSPFLFVKQEGDFVEGNFCFLF
jgi:hypothetical protein